jgi:hypothetical protein
MKIEWEVEISFDITFEKCEEQVVEIEYEPEYEVVEYEVVETYEESSEEEVEIEIDTGFECDGWEAWGEECRVPAKGWFAQFGNKNSVDFWDFRLTETNEIRGVGSDAVGTFDLWGSMDDNHNVCFAKQYRGAHRVDYYGRFHAKKHVITGTWEIPGNCDGTYNIQVGWQKWKGKFFQGGQGFKMAFDNMYIGEGGAVGSGTDDVGTFDIKGWRNGNQVTFAKAYRGAHTVFYSGEFDGKKLKGTWQIPGNCDGKFKLKCNRNLEW